MTGLTLGAVDFCDPAGGIWAVKDGQSTWDSPQAATAIVDSLIADGSIVKWLRDDNREVSFTAAITGPNSLVLAQREKTLIEELYRPNLLTYTPPDGLAPASVYEISTSTAAMQFDVDRELALIRLYTITLTAQPYVRSADLTTFSSAPSGAGSPVTVSSGSSASGWDSPVAKDGSNAWLKTPTVSTGWAPPPAGDGFGLVMWSATAIFRMSATDFTTTPYVCIDIPAKLNVLVDGDVRQWWGGSPTLKVNDGATIAPLTSYVSPDTAGWMRFVFSVPDQSAVTSLEFDFAGSVPITDPSGATRPSNALFKSVIRSGLPPGLAAHEETFTAAIGGSRRAPASLHLSTAGGGAIGDAVIVSGALQAGFAPGLRSYVAAGTGDVDASAWTGFTWSTLQSGSLGWPRVSIPVDTVASGAYVLVVRLGQAVAATDRLWWTAETGGVTATSTSKYLLAAKYDLVILGTAMLPPVEVPTLSSSLTLDVAIRYGTGVLTIDNAWLLPLTADITVLSDAPEHVWLDAPTIDVPTPRIYAGSLPDRSDAIGASSLAIGGWAAPLVDQPSLSVHAACAATDLQVGGSYYKRWHTHAAEGS